MRDIRCNNKHFVPPSSLSLWRHARPRSRPPPRKKREKTKNKTKKNPREEKKIVFYPTVCKIEHCEKISPSLESVFFTRFPSFLDFLEKLDWCFQCLVLFYARDWRVNAARWWKWATLGKFLNGFRRRLSRLSCGSEKKTKKRKFWLILPELELKCRKHGEWALFITHV